MNTIVYVDGFNLYYRALKGSPHKWLNLQALCEASLPKHCKIVGINFYTARISSRIDPSSPRDQHIYLKALQTIPGLQQHFGSFRVTDLFMYLDQPVMFRPEVEKLPEPAPRYARVVKSEEKGSDVNLGVHLVRDAFQGKFEHAAVITNDTDLVEPLRIVTEDAKLPVTLLTPADQTAKSLRNVATYVRRIRNHLGVSQFPNPVVTPDGTVLAKPENW